MTKQTCWILITVIFVLTTFGCSNDDTGTGNPLPNPLDELLPLSFGLTGGLEFESGIEPGDPSVCNAASSNQCWWVDADAPTGGDGSFLSPFNSFEVLIGYRKSNGNYVTGIMSGGDHVYVTGTFQASKNVEEQHEMRLVIGRGNQGGTDGNPTIIKSYPGKKRAIFDGEFLLGPMIDISALSGNPLGNIVIQNMEVQNSLSMGIAIRENVIKAEINNVVVHDCTIRPGASSAGGIVFEMRDAQHSFILRNSIIHSNRRTEDGSGFYTDLNNNYGGVNILNQTSAHDGSIIEIYDNIIYDENYAIRHKHSGNITTLAHRNVIFNSNIAFYIRAYNETELHHNGVYNVKTAVELVAENQNGDAFCKIFNNTVIAAGTLLDTGFDVTDFERSVILRDNILSSTASTTPIVLGNYTSSQFDLTGFTSKNNLFDVPNGVSFIRHIGVDFNFSEGKALVGDSTSFEGDPGFLDPDNYLFVLTSESSAKNAGSLGQDIGCGGN